MRAVDAVALLCLVAGVLTYLYAQRGMTALATGTLRHASVTGPEGPWHLADWARFERLSNIGLGVAAAGLVLSLAAHLISRSRRPPAEHR